MDLLHANGIAVDLATATASPPPWLTTSTPEILPGRPPAARRSGRAAASTGGPPRRSSASTRCGLVRTHGRRGTRDHPALAAWHVSNELGCHNVYDYSDDAAAAFRDLAARALRRRSTRSTTPGARRSGRSATATGTQILPPRLAASHPNPTQQLDFKRFSSDALKDYLRAERDLLREHHPRRAGHHQLHGDGRDRRAWTTPTGPPRSTSSPTTTTLQPGPQARDELSFSANLTGNLAGGRPWFLMEHSTSAVNWQPVNVAKKPGELARDSLTHVAHGADAVCFFQWRQSAAGAEKYHSAMVPARRAPTATCSASVAGLGADPADARAGRRARRDSRPGSAILFDWDVLVGQPSRTPTRPTGCATGRRRSTGTPRSSAPRRPRRRRRRPARRSTATTLVVAPDPARRPGGAGRAAARATSTAAATWSPRTSPASSTRTTTSGSAATPARCATCSASGSRSSRRCSTTRRVELDNGADRHPVDRPDRRHRPDVEVLARYTTGEQAGRPAITRRAGRRRAPRRTSRPGSARTGLPAVLDELLGPAGVVSELPGSARGRVELAIRTTTPTSSGS